eukprot:4210931-Ditylum_brightwellii.AAC.1
MQCKFNKEEEQVEASQEKLKQTETPLEEEEGEDESNESPPKTFIPSEEEKQQQVEASQE